MNDPQTEAIAYLSARGDVPWRWGDDGNVIQWTDGTTVAFRDELALILERLIPQGWPHFGALIWMLAACRGKLPPPVEEAVAGGWPAEQEGEDGQMVLPPFLRHVRARQVEVERCLKAIADLPPELRNAPRAKAVLAEIVFHLQSEARPKTLLEDIVSVLRSGGLNDALLNAPDQPPQPGEWMALHQGLASLDLETLRTRLRTGLDALPLAAPLPVTPSGRVRALLETWQTDSEHASLARLTRDLMAALQLPRKLSEFDDMPLGGFSDLSNRGSLDRLLLSELAHDDLTLAVRIALQEALYLRREPPARQPPGTLAILLDAGLRTWGIPRVFITATALALVAKSVKHETVTVFRAHGAELDPVDLFGSEGVTAHLGTLRAHPHPGLALPAFRAALEETDRPEAVLITQREVLADPEFRRCLAEADLSELYLAVVDRDGTFEMFRYPLEGKPLCQAKMNLAQLLPVSPFRHPQPLSDAVKAGDLPFFLLVHPSPLLLAVRGKIRGAAKTADGGGICVTPDRRLLYWASDQRGAQTVAHGLPAGRTLFVGEIDDQHFCVVKEDGWRRNIACRVLTRAGECVQSRDWIAQDHVDRIECQGWLLFEIGRKTAEVRDLRQGSVLGRIDIHRLRSCGPYFYKPVESGWTVLRWSGQALSLDAVELPGNLRHTAVCVFNRPGMEGPWCVDANGDVYSHEGRQVFNLGEARYGVKVSADGNRLMAKSYLDRTIQWRLIDLTTQQVWAVADRQHEDESLMRPEPPMRNLLVHFNAISIGEGDAINLFNRNGCWQIRWDEGALRAEMGNRGLYDSVPFRPIDVPKEQGVKLKMAQWPDGRRAWLDERGMLHLRRHRPVRGEITLVLREGRLSGWASIGQWYGDPFFIGDRKLLPEPNLLELLSEFCTPNP